MATKKVTDLAEVTTLNNSDTFMVHDGNGLKKTTFSNLKGKVTEGKADEATTLAGYGITDAYTKDETQKNYGLNFSVGFNSSYIPITIDTTTDIQNGTFTSADIVTAFISSDVKYIRSGAFTGCTNLKSVNIMNKAEGITIEQDAFGYDVQVNYINSYNYLKYAGIALRNLNTQKANKSSTLAGYGITDAYTKNEADGFIVNKADKATTISGYGITDAYTKDETQKNYGLNFSVGFNSSYIPITIDTTTDIQNGTFTSADIVTAFISSDVEYIRSGAFTGCTNLKSVYILNTPENITVGATAFNEGVQINYINSYNYLKYAATALRNMNTQKADNTNVYSRTVLDGKFAALPTYEEGSGTLTPSTENKLKNASFTYQRLGNCVTVQVACTFLAYEQTADGTVRLDGLPFVCGNNLPPRLLNITSQKREVISAISYSTSALVLIFRQAESFTEDETLSFSITYKIK